MRHTITRALVSLCALACALPLGGCWGRNFWRAQEASIETSVKVDSLLRENALLQRRVYQLEKALDEQREFVRRSGARTSTDLEEIKDQLSALLGMIDETGRTLPPRSVQPPVTDPARESPVPLEPDSTAAPGAADAARSDDDPPDAAPAPSAEQIYRQIYLDFSRMDYEIALEESAVFLSEHPHDPLLEEVRFLRGECFMELGRDFDALKEYSTLLQEFPRGRRSPAALLRMAMSYERIGDRALAAGVVRRLVREYPASGEAAEARVRFSGMLDER